MAGELADGLPDAIRRAVRHNKVPRELHEDLWRLADRLQPLAVAIRRNAGKLPQLATRTALATEQAAVAGAEVSTTPLTLVDHFRDALFPCWSLRGCTVTSLPTCWDPLWVPALGPRTDTCAGTSYGYLRCP